MFLGPPIMSVVGLVGSFTDYPWKGGEHVAKESAKGRERGITSE